MDRAAMLGRNEAAIGAHLGAPAPGRTDHDLLRLRPAPAELVALESRREAPRVPFGSLVERGLLQPGEVLVDAARRWSAKVRADGSLISAEHRGSIHSVAAQLQGAPACNGWAFWHVERKGELVLIDRLRQQIRGELG